MSSIIIREYQKNDESSILDICYKTGFMGDDLTDTNRFNDKTLFGYLFCVYYTRYESQNAFVAVDTESDKVIGYILGTENTLRQELNFIFRMGWRIFMRLFFYTSWRYPESFLATFHFIWFAEYETGVKNIFYDFPAHLHIDIISEYQKYGVGSKLLTAFENKLIKNHVKGIHLRTSNKNYKALPFYTKNNYRIVSKKDSHAWSGIEGYESVIFVKELERDYID